MALTLLALTPDSAASYNLQNTPSSQSRHLELTNGKKSYFWSCEDGNNSIAETRNKKSLSQVLL